MSSGFVAGTLVHTDKGLIPIQDLKVGDLVLTGDEKNSKDNLIYKKVLNTFSSSDKQKIFRVAFETIKKDIESVRLDAIKKEETYPIESEYNGLSYLFCTENQFFWTKEEGWIKAVELPVERRFKNEDRDYTLSSFDEIPIYGVSLDSFATPLYKTNLANVAIQTCEKTNYYGEIITLIDFNNLEPKILKNAKIWNKTIDEDDWNENQSFIDLEMEVSHPYSHNSPNQVKFEWASDIFGEGEEKYYIDNFYNIEVEQTNQYFIGSEGIKVGDSTIQGTSE